MMSAIENDKYLFPIAGIVIALHAVFIALLAFFSPHPSPLIKPKEKLVVHTVKLAPRPIATAPPQKGPPAVVAEPEPVVAELEVEAEPLLEPEPEPKPQVEPKPAPPAPAKAPEKPKLVKKGAGAKPVAKATPKPAPKPAPKPVSKPVAKKSPPAKTAPKKNVTQAPSPPDPKIAAAKKKKQELLARAQGALAKLNQKDTSASKGEVASLDHIKLPSQIGALAVDSLRFEEPASGFTARERSYRDELASRLKLLLKLPEYGLVKLKLTLARNGKVTHVDILSSESAANRTYIQKTLKTLTFPAFGDNFGSETSHTFQITLSSD